MKTKGLFLTLPLTFPESNNVELNGTLFKIKEVQTPDVKCTSKRYKPRGERYLISF